MSNLFTGPEENSPSSVERFFNDVGHATAKFHGRLIEPIKGDWNTMCEFASRFVSFLKEKLLSNRESKSIDNNGKVSSSKITLISHPVKLSFKEKIKNLFRNDGLRHVAKFLLFAAGTALFIAGMFFPPVSAIAALTILGIAVTRFIFKAVHIIKQAKVESKLTENKLIFGIKTAFKLLVAAAEIPAFFFVGPLASLITQPISGAILGIMKAYDDIKTEKRMFNDQECIDKNVEDFNDHELASDNVDYE